MQIFVRQVAAWSRKMEYRSRLREGSGVGLTLESLASFTAKDETP